MEQQVMSMLKTHITEFRYGRLGQLMDTLDSAAFQARQLFVDLRKDRERMVALAALIAKGDSPTEAQEKVAYMHDSFINY